MHWIMKEITKSNSDKTKPQRLEINKTILTLSSGAILLTFTALQLLLRNKPEFNFNLIKISWLLFGLSIFSSIAVQILFVTWDIVWDRSYRQGKPTSGAKNLLNANLVMFWTIPIAETITYYSFFIGIILITIFLFKSF